MGGGHMGDSYSAAGIEQMQVFRCTHASHGLKTSGDTWGQAPTRQPEARSLSAPIRKCLPTMPDIPALSMLSTAHQAVIGMASPGTLTFRLRRCPVTVNETALCDRLSQAFGDITPTDIRIQSLATTLGPFETPPTKTATLSFAKLPSVVETQIKKGEWMIESHGLDGSLILDTNFRGMTPLNDVEAQKHDFE